MPKCSHPAATPDNASHFGKSVQVFTMDWTWHGHDDPYPLSVPVLVNQLRCRSCGDSVGIETVGDTVRGNSRLQEALRRFGPRWRFVTREERV